MVLKHMKLVMGYILCHEAHFRAVMEEQLLLESSEKIRSKQKQYDRDEKRITELKRLFMKIYEDNAAGRLSDDRYEMLSSSYETEQKQLEAEVIRLRKEIEVQESAAPSHDWNEKVSWQCYSPNGTSRIVDGNNKILEISNNYQYMSFNFGPTLLSWMEQFAPLTYERIIKADIESVSEHSGHGNAIAQVYNHIIMPLANEQDKRTQIKWGIRDFE